MGLCIRNNKSCFSYYELQGRVTNLWVSVPVTSLQLQAPPLLSSRLRPCRRAWTLLWILQRTQHGNVLQYSPLFLTNNMHVLWTAVRIFTRCSSATLKSLTVIDTNRSLSIMIGKNRCGAWITHSLNDLMRKRHHYDCKYFSHSVDYASWYNCVIRTNQLHFSFLHLKAYRSRDAPPV